MAERFLSPAAQLLALSAGAAGVGYFTNKHLRKKRDVAMTPGIAALLAAAVPIAYQAATGTGVAGNFRRWGAGGLLSSEWYDTPHSERVNKQSYQDSFMNRAKMPGSKENSVYNQMASPELELKHSYLPRTSYGDMIKTLSAFAKGLR